MPAKPKVTLYQERYSHHCVKAAKLLDFKGIDHEVREVGYHDKRELLKASQQDYVPWLQWGDEGVAWDKLVDFVEAKVPKPSAYPPGLEGPARILEQWSHDVLEERVWRYVRPEVGVTFSDPIERWVFEEIQHWKRGPVEESKAKQPQFLADMTQHLARLETCLDGRDFLLADAPCVADFAAFGAIFPLTYVGQDIPREFAKLRSWNQRLAKV
ncbi:MAG: glutathione S-transferase family protein [Halobacteriales archaeon]|nr:glutathione S-transferase family protein [Halobacteriales archaeon]